MGHSQPLLWWWWRWFGALFKLLHTRWFKNKDDTLSMCVHIIIRFKAKRNEMSKQTVTIEYVRKIFAMSLKRKSYKIGSIVPDFHHTPVEECEGSQGAYFIQTPMRRHIIYVHVNWTMYKWSKYRSENLPMAYFPIRHNVNAMENDGNNKMRSFELGKVNNISQSTLTK